MGASTYLANKVVDHVLKTASFTQPTNIYASLHSADQSVAQVPDRIGGQIDSIVPDPANRLGTCIRD